MFLVSHREVRIAEQHIGGRNPAMAAGAAVRAS
jgi:hypothetical protein